MKKLRATFPDICPFFTTQQPNVKEKTMKPNTNHKSKSPFLFSTICFLFFISYSAVQAQKIPDVFQKNADNFIQGQEKNFYQKLITKYDAARVGGDEEETRQARNDLINEAIFESDRSFDIYKKSYSRRNKWFQTIVDLLAVAGTSAAVITNGVRPKTIISQSVSFLQGGQTVVSKDLQLGMLTAIFNKAEENRTNLLINIYKKLGDPNRAFGWSDAKILVHAYWAAGSVEDALSGLIKDSEIKKETAQEARAAALTQASISDAPTPIQVALSKKNREVLDSLFNPYDDAKAQVKVAINAVEAAQEQIDAAQKEIESAQQLVREADNAVNDENRKSEKDRDANVIERATKSKADAFASIQAKTSERDAATLALDRATAIKATAIASAENKRLGAIKSLKSIYAAILNDPVLLPLLNDLPSEFGKGNPDFKTKIQKSLDNLKGNTDDSKVEIEDYRNVLFLLNGSVTNHVMSDSSIIDRVKAVLEANK